MNTFTKNKGMFSRSSEYGIKACIYIAQQTLKSRRTSLSDIATAIGSPEAFTAKILQILSKHKIIKSIKGYAGGYILDEEQIETLNLLTIVKAIDGDQLFEGCGLGLKECNEKTPCPIHNEFKKVRFDLIQMLKTSLIKSLAINLEKGNVQLKLYGIN